MSDMTINLATKMEGLKQKYLIQLEPRIDALKIFVKTCEHAAPDIDLINETCAMAHKLSGSGATYGFAAISEAAQGLEDLLCVKPAPPYSVMCVKAKLLLEACENAHGAQPLSLPSALPSSSDREDNMGGLPVILLVDDDESIRQLLLQVFQEDAQIVMAQNGIEALDVLKRLNPSLILLDDHMPQFGGFAFLEEIKKQLPDKKTPIMMLTASHKNTDVIMAFRFGVVDYISKPFDPPTLRMRVLDFIDRNRRKILIADDDPALLNLLNVKFSVLGFRVLLAQDIAEARTKTFAEKPDLILLDRMLPGGDGLSLFLQLRAHADTKMIPVIFLTAKRREGDILEALKQGAQDYIVKPFKVDEVVARCTRLLNSQKTEPQT